MFWTASAAVRSRIMQQTLSAMSIQALVHPPAELDTIKADQNAEHTASMATCVVCSVNRTWHSLHDTCRTNASVWLTLLIH